MRSAKLFSASMLVVFAAAGVLTITMGGRQTMGLFVSPLNTSTGLGIVAISFAMAVGQFVWGAAQPVAGALADRYGPERVLIGGVVLIIAAVCNLPIREPKMTPQPVPA